jgi:hypothetical protein
MTIEELEARVVALDQEIAAKRDEKRAAARALEQAHIDADVARTLDAMSPAHRAAVAQVLGVAGVASGETFGSTSSAQ